MTALHTLRALDSNRRFTERKEAEGRMAQARRDLDAGVIDAEEYAYIFELCRKIIRAGG
ncbi:hypothetical protein GJQ55_07030 [Venatoribacter cucullus]|uniref:Uncharacterized protein n=1 Tax=Venatoribacter cucullus TaxID=2661630 RepID=A0A9X7UWK7_9GAMM|nr:hypothetical protein [Venatoribacter cucullus]QQD24245.1 hypothetical protein GJQ55_07030 [Venatoribacter cucullus]